MERRTFISLLAVPLTSQAQAPGRIHRLGVLSPGARSSTEAGLPSFLVSNLRQLGYVEGRDLVIEVRFAEDLMDQLPRLARELVEIRSDVIVAIGTPAIRAASSVTTAVPIVFLTNTDPVGAGLVASLSRPGGNVTGILIAPEGTLGEKKLALLKEMVPRATRIALLVPDTAGTEMNVQVQEVRKAGVRLSLEIIVIEVRRGDYEKAFTAIIAARPAALFVGANSRFVRDRQEIIKLAASYRLPAIYEWPQQVRDGGLMSYGASDTETYRRVAVYVDRILNGAPPSDLPIEQPSRLLLVINLKTARTMGLAIPQSLLLRSDDLIE